MPCRSINSGIVTPVISVYSQWATRSTSTGGVYQITECPYGPTRTVANTAGSCHGLCMGISARCARSMSPDVPSSKRTQMR